MRHRVGHRKLGRVTEHRIALLRNQAEALLTHEHITTTVPKAKELRPFVEKLITTAKRGVRAAEPKGATLSARRLVCATSSTRTWWPSCSTTWRRASWSGRAATRRILKLGYRRGDGAETALIELVGVGVRPQEGGRGEGCGSRDRRSAEVAEERR